MDIIPENAPRENAAQAVRQKAYERLDPENRFNIPDIMRTSSRWIVWKQTPAKSKPRKLPLSAKTLSGVQWQDRKNWSNFEAALNSFRRHSELLGVGFVLGDTFCGVDIDNCRNPETGEIEPWAATLISKLDSYTEVSPSGTGVKIIVTGEIPEGRG
jgi:primase-polymerase (primpol)-like protein